MSSGSTRRPWNKHVDVRVRALALLMILPAAAFLANVVILALIGVLTLVIIPLTTSWKAFWRIARFYLILSTVGLTVLSLVLNRGTLTERLLAGLILAVRFNVLVALGVTYSLTTNPNEILQALLRMHIPHRFGMLIMIGFRLYPLILDRMQTILQSARARGLDMSFSLTSTRFVRNLGLVIPSLLLTTLEVGVYLGETMLTRGYDPNRPITISPNIRLRALDYLLLAGCMSLLLISIVDPLAEA